MPSIPDDLIAGETPFPLAELPAQTFVPRRRGKRLHRSAAFRWATSGKDGQRLETIKTPTGISTTRSAVLRFFSALTDPDAAARPSIRTPARRAREIAAAERELAAAGIC